MKPTDPVHEFLHCMGKFEISLAEKSVIRPTVQYSC